MARKAKKKSATKKPATKKPATKRPPLVTFKVTAKEKAALAAKAKKYCAGNISRWLRFAGVHFTPTAKQAS